MKKFGVAKFGFPELSAEDLFEQISNMLYDSEDGDYARFRANQIKELLEFEETKGDLNLNKMIKYTSKFGQMHLINPTHRASYMHIYDLDIKLSVLAIVFLTYASFSLVFCGKKDESDVAEESVAEEEKEEVKDN